MVTLWAWIFAHILGALVIALWLRWNYSRSAPLELGGGSTITPGKFSAAAVTLFGLAITMIGSLLLSRGELVSGLPCLVVGLFMALFMLPSLTRMHDVTWNTAGVNGPCRLFGPGLGRSRTTIKWTEINLTGKTVTSFWFIQARDGRRIYWSYLYPGYGRLVDDLRRKLPHLELPRELR